MYRVFKNIFSILVFMSVMTTLLGICALDSSIVIGCLMTLAGILSSVGFATITCYFSDLDEKMSAYHYGKGTHQTHN